MCSAGRQQLIPSHMGGAGGAPWLGRRQPCARPAAAEPICAGCYLQPSPAELGLWVLAELLGRLLVAPGGLRCLPSPLPWRLPAGKARAARGGDPPGLSAPHDAALAVQSAAGGAGGRQLRAHSPHAKTCRARCPQRLCGYPDTGGGGSIGWEWFVRPLQRLRSSI